MVELARNQKTRVNIPSHETCIRRLRAVSEAAIAITSELSVDKALQKIVDTARELVNAKYAALGVADEQRRTLVAFYVSGLTPEEIEAIGPKPQGLGLLGLLLKEPRPIRVKDIAQDHRSIGVPPNHPKMSSFLGAPVVSKNRILGNFYMADKIGHEEFSQEDEDMLTLFAAHAAVAIENALLYTETSQNLRQKIAEVERSGSQARFLSELGSLLLAAPLREELPLQKVAERLTDALGDAGGIYLVDEGEPTLPARTAVHHANPSRRQLAEEVVGEAWTYLQEAVLSNRQAILAPLKEDDHGDDPSPLRGLVTNRHGFTGILAVPIAVGDRAHGILVSLSTQPLELTQDDLRFASLVADRLAVKIDSIRLYQQLGSQSSLLESILDTMSEAVYVASPDGSILCVNDSYARLIGADSKKDAMRSLAEYSQLLHPRHEDGRPMSFEELPMSRALRGETCNDAVMLIAPLGDQADRFLGVSGAPILDEKGSIFGAVNVGRDITEAKRLDRLKDEFISVASHEMKSPVAAAKGYAQLLVKRLQTEGDHPKELQLAENASRQIDRMAQLLERLLDVSRLQTGRMVLYREELDLAQLAADVAQRMQMTTDRHSIRVDLDGPVHVTVDRTRIEQVLTNLTSNAIRYSPTAGQIEIAVKSTTEHALLFVRDQGSGIPEEKRPYIFERFFRAADEGGGLGLGLYVSRSIVESHGGKIWFESKEGRGSTFYFILPLEESLAKRPK